MSATGRATQTKKQIILRFTPDEIAKMEYLKKKYEINSNNELFIYLMFDHDNVSQRAKFEEKEKDRFRDALTEQKLASAKFLNCLKELERVNEIEIKGLRPERSYHY